MNKVKVQIVLKIVTLVIVLISVSALPNFWITFISGIMLLAIVTASLDIAWGLTGIIVFGPMLFFGIGAYFCAIFLKEGIDLALAFVCLNLFVIVLCFLVFVPALYRKLKPIQFGLITLIISIVFQQVSINLYEFTGGSNGLINYSDNAMVFGQSLSLNSINLKYGISLVFSSLVLVFLYYIKKSSLGKLITYIRDLPLRASTLGYDVPKYQSFIFILFAILSAYAGFLYAPIIEVVHPGLFSITYNVLILVWLIIGGKGTIYGPFLAAILLNIMEFILGSEFSSYYLIIVGVILLLSVLFYKRGIFFKLFKL